MSAEKQHGKAEAKIGLDIAEAVREGNVDGVRAYVEAGGNINLASPSTGRTLLHIACRQVVANNFW